MQLKLVSKKVTTLHPYLTTPSLIRLNRQLLFVVGPNAVQHINEPAHDKTYTTICVTSEDRSVCASTQPDQSLR